MSETELIHYGVLGMKWGVRRYQNYDGTYTKKGLERYNKAKLDYDLKKAAYNSAKEADKSGRGPKSEVKSAKADLRTAKKTLNKSYSKLKNDKLADQGKHIYNAGRTITDNEAAIKVASSIAGISTSVTAKMIANGQRFVSTNGSLNIAAISAATIAAGSVAATAYLTGRGQYDKRRLRAYYSHSS